MDIAWESAYFPQRRVTLSSCEYLLARERLRPHSSQPAIRPVLRTRQAYRGMRRLPVNRMVCTRVVRASIGTIIPRYGERAATACSINDPSGLCEPGGHLRSRFREYSSPLAI